MNSCRGFVISGKALLVLPDCFFQSEIQCVGYQRMSYRHFVEERYTLVEELQVGEAEVVTCIYAKTCLVGCAACLDEGSHCFSGLVGYKSA